jgi:hypothetical protein
VIYFPDYSSHMEVILFVLCLHPIYTSALPEEWALSVVKKIEAMPDTGRIRVDLVNSGSSDMIEYSIASRETKKGFSTVMILGELFALHRTSAGSVGLDNIDVICDLFINSPLDQFSDIPVVSSELAPAATPFANANRVCSSLPLYIKRIIFQHRIGRHVANLRDDRKQRTLPSLFYDPRARPVGCRPAALGDIRSNTLLIRSLLGDRAAVRSWYTSLVKDVFETRCLHVFSYSVNGSIMLKRPYSHTPESYLKLRSVGRALAMSLVLSVPFRVRLSPLITRALIGFKNSHRFFLSGVSAPEFSFPDTESDMDTQFLVYGFAEIIPSEVLAGLIDEVELSAMLSDDRGESGSDTV